MNPRQTAAGFVFVAMMKAFGCDPFDGDVERRRRVQRAIGDSVGHVVDELCRWHVRRSNRWRFQLRELMDPKLTKKRRRELLAEIERDLDPVGLPPTRPYDDPPVKDVAARKVH